MSHFLDAFADELIKLGQYEPVAPASISTAGKPSFVGAGAPTEEWKKQRAATENRKRQVALIGGAAAKTRPGRAAGSALKKTWELASGKKRARERAMVRNLPEPAAPKPAPAPRRRETGGPRSAHAALAM
jgi:hypothetical protein